MTDSLSYARRLMSQLRENQPTFSELLHMQLESGALDDIPAFLKRRSLSSPIIVADANTFEAAGTRLMDALVDEGLEPNLCIIQPDTIGNVVADAESILQLLIEVKPERTGCLIAVGSGTIHDITRFAAHRSGKPFISVPTAPSVDGFTSAGAPIVVRGVKETFQASAPIALFADLDILVKAPQLLVAAGFGDMLGKYTSLLDWRFSSHTAREPYDEQVAGITQRALESCVQHVEDIGKRTETGIQILMTALIESGIAMLLFGQSHPASGAEHHLSHYWEMAYLQKGRKALLHGAKVGVASSEISQLYHDAAERGEYPYAEPQDWKQHRQQVQEWLRQVPSREAMASLLRQAGGPANLRDLGVDEELFAQSLREAHALRNRHTILKALNEDNH
ncbi:sn-glycerol-1-phosphate dehydrogenase [Paenibacillus sp. JCM 10914]|uniref:sn-glycerol-1-phosphate dehydrogenase n=1 Tax=Paenibacillus sp. JCM 10914 TaxID=1236974 RepID=UPI0003CCB27A|nr:sn-glycerol-1-phosphate dehydrogenase [Paenibacillus sp. JCM 10914]GAE04075.1 3-oxoacyl-[acyl-carrier protein] reductase [Paenibacillus sp. JCM 10914]